MLSSVIRTVVKVTVFSFDKINKNVTLVENFCCIKIYTIKNSDILAKPLAFFRVKWWWCIQFVTSVGQRKTSESPTGFEPMTFHTPVGCSNHWATERLMWWAAIYTSGWSIRPVYGRAWVRIPLRTQIFFFVPRLWQLNTEQYDGA